MENQTKCTKIYGFDMEGFCEQYICLVSYLINTNNFKMVTISQDVEFLYSKFDIFDSNLSIKRYIQPSYLNEGRCFKLFLSSFSFSIYRERNSKPLYIGTYKDIMYL